MPLRFAIERDGVWSELAPPTQVLFLSQAVLITRALSLAAEIGIADLLVAGPQNAEELARSTSSDPQALYRVLRLLGSVGVFSEIEPGRFALTPLGDCLRTGTPGSLRSWLRMSGLPMWYRAIAEAMDSLKTGASTFERANGAAFFDYLAAHPDEGGVFNSSMDDFGRAVAAAVVQSYDFREFRKIVDVGGGHGTLLAAILQANPQMTGILFDAPHVVASAAGLLSPTEIASRCHIVGGDFFQSVPAGADVYILRWIIHDWEHDRAVAILRNCHSAMDESGRVLLVEAVLPPGDEPHISKLMDFSMLTSLGGQERTKEEYGQLLREAGFRLNRIVPTGSPLSVVEGIPI